MLRRRRQISPGPRPGFTLVEILIAAVVMVVSTIGSTLLFNQATRQGLTGNQRLQEQLAVSRDLASILEVNERYSCAAGGCTATLSAVQHGQELPPPPDQDGYAPADIDASPEGIPSFRDLCARGLLTNLISALGARTLEGTGVRRTVSLLDAASSGTAQASIPPHRYRVDWRNAEGRLLRQVQLIPTVAAWCP